MEQQNTAYPEASEQQQAIPSGPSARALYDYQAGNRNILHLNEIRKTFLRIVIDTVFQINIVSF